MLTATRVLIGGVVVAGAAVAVAALLSPAPQAPLPSPPPVATDMLIDLPAGLKAVPLLQVPDDAAAPLLIVLHGREGTEGQLRSFVPDDLGARVFFVRGNLPSAKIKNRYSFFDARYLGGDEAALVEGIDTAADHVAAAIAQLRPLFPTTKVLVLGSSQGGHIAYELAVERMVDGAVSMSGALPPVLRPVVPGKAKVIGLHGTKDAVVPYKAGRATVDAFKQAGYPAPEWIPIIGAAHDLTKARPKTQAALRQLAV